MFNFLKFATDKGEVSKLKRPSVGKYWKRGFDTEANIRLENLRRAAEYKQEREAGGPLNPDPPGGDEVIAQREGYLPVFRNLREVLKRKRRLRFPSVQGEEFADEVRKDPWKAHKSKRDIGDRATLVAQIGRELDESRLNDDFGDKLMKEHGIYVEGMPLPPHYKDNPYQLRFPNSKILAFINRYGTEEDARIAKNPAEWASKSDNRGRKALSAPVKAALALANQKNLERTWRRSLDRTPWERTFDHSQLIQFARDFLRGNMRSDFSYQNGPPVGSIHVPRDFWPSIIQRMDPKVVRGEHLNHPNDKYNWNFILNRLVKHIPVNGGYYMRGSTIDPMRRVVPNLFWHEDGRPRFNKDELPEFLHREILPQEFEPRDISKPLPNVVPGSEYDEFLNRTSGFDPSDPKYSKGRRRRNVVPAEQPGDLVRYRNG